MSEYWVNSPMQCNTAQGAKDFIQNILLFELNPNMLKEKERSKEICRKNNIKNIEKGMIEYVRFHTKYAKWLTQECIDNEFNIIKVLKNIIEVVNNAKELDIDYGIDSLNNEMLYVIPLSFLEWKVEIDSNTEISKYLLSLLKQTDGGSTERGFSTVDNKYPNGINTPSDFIKNYINNWDKLITGEMLISNIKFTEKVI